MPRREPFAPFGVTKASQLATKSDQWFADAQFVYRHGRYAAALYLGGFVIECLLKAALWEQRFEPSIRALLFGSHDLDGLLKANADLLRDISRDRIGTHRKFVQLSGWTVKFRYNPRRVDARDARAFMERLIEVRRWLRQRI